MPLAGVFVRCPTQKPTARVDVSWVACRRHWSPRDPPCRARQVAVPSFLPIHLAPPRRSFFCGPPRSRLNVALQFPYLGADVWMKILRPALVNPIERDAIGGEFERAV